MKLCPPSCVGALTDLTNGGLDDISSPPFAQMIIHTSPCNCMCVGAWPEVLNAKRRRARWWQLLSRPLVMKARGGGDEGHLPLTWKMVRFFCPCPLQASKLQHAAAGVVG